jgi:hypothetical protein
LLGQPEHLTPTRVDGRHRSSDDSAIPVVALVNLLFGIGFALIARSIRADGPFAAPAFGRHAARGVVVAPSRSTSTPRTRRGADVLGGPAEVAGVAVRC